MNDFFKYLDLSVFAYYSHEYRIRNDDSGAFNHGIYLWISGLFAHSTWSPAMEPSTLVFKKSYTKFLRLWPLNKKIKINKYNNLRNGDINGRYII